jgi:hypothetical protein
VVLEAAMEITALVPRNYLTTCKSYAFVQGWIGPPKQQPQKKKLVMNYAHIALCGTWSFP